jgi:hypothetical protein
VGRDVVTVVSAVAAHPSIWWSALTAVARLSRRRWWRRRPFLPVPGEAYWVFRLVTAFGGTGEDAVVRADDVVAYLRWCRRTQPHRGSLARVVTSLMAGANFSWTPDEATAQPLAPYHAGPVA